MSLIALIKEAGVGTVSKENITDTPLVQETVVSPVDSPSASIPVATDPIEPEVVAQAPMVEPPVVESVVAPIPVDAVPMIPVEEAETAVAEAVEITQIEATGQLLEAEQCAIQDKADELLEIQTALEHLTTIIRKTGVNGIANQTAEAIQIQLRSVNRKLGITSQFVSTESFKARDPRAQHENAVIALESIKTSIKVAKNKFIEIIEKLIALFKKTVNNYLDGVNTLEKKADQLDQRLGALKKTGVGGSITVKNAGVVLLDDSWDIPDDIPGLAHFASVGYPEGVIKYLNNSAKVLLKYKGDNFDHDRLTEEFNREAKPLQHLINMNVKNDKLPGGYYMDVSEDGLSFGIKGEAPTDVVKEIVILPTVELRKKVRQIKEIIIQVKEIRPEVGKIDKASRRLIEATNRATESWGKDQTQAEEYMDTVHDAILRSSASKPRIDEVIKYLIRYLSMQLAICTTMASEIESGNAESSNSDPLREKYSNVFKFMAEGRIEAIRASLYLCFNYKKTTYSEIMQLSEIVAKEFPNLWVPYEVKAFAREIIKDEADWTEDYFNSSIGWLKTNFAKERFENSAKVAQYLGFIQ